MRKKLVLLISAIMVFLLMAAIGQASAEAAFLPSSPGQARDNTADISSGAIKSGASSAQTDTQINVQTHILQQMQAQLDSAKRAVEEVSKAHDYVLGISLLFFAAAAIVVTIFLFGAGYLLRKLSKMSEVIKQYARDEKVLQSLQKKIREDDQVTDLAPNELERAALHSAPVALAMLASDRKNWDAASFLWKIVVICMPRNHQARFQYARALSFLAVEKNTGPSEKNVLLQEAKGLYEQLREPYAKHRGLHANYGNCLASLAVLASDATEKRELLNQSVACFQQGHNITGSVDFLENMEKSLKVLLENNDDATDCRQTRDFLKKTYQRWLDLEPKNSVVRRKLENLQTEESLEVVTFEGATLPAI